jgi:hypothetical protein
MLTIVGNSNRRIDTNSAEGESRPRLVYVESLTSIRSVKLRDVGGGDLLDKFHVSGGAVIDSDSVRKTAPAQCDDGSCKDE